MNDIYFRGTEKSTRMIQMLFRHIEANQKTVLCTLNIKKFKHEYKLWTGYDLIYEKLEGQGYKVTHKKVNT